MNSQPFFRMWERSHVHDKERDLLGPEAFYSTVEYLKGSLVGSPRLLAKFRRASRLSLVLSVWLIQSIVVLISKFSLDASIEYRIVNPPIWVAQIDIQFYMDRTMTLQALATTFVVPVSMGLLLLFRTLLSSYIARKMGQHVELSSSAMAMSTLCLPEAARVLALSLYRVATMSPLVVTYDLIRADSVWWLAQLAEQARAILDSFYKFDVKTSLLIGGPFLLWEIFLLYRAFRYTFNLDREDAAWATAALGAFQIWVAVKFPISLVVPRYYLDPFNFRFQAPVGGVG